MPGFFETIVNRKTDGSLLAAWVPEGSAAGSRALFAQKGEQYTECFRDPNFPDKLAKAILNADRRQTGIVELDGALIFLEQISDRKQLIICGAGHVSQCVIRMAVTLGYEVTAIEDREGFAAKAREAGAQRVICKPFGKALAEIGEEPSAAYVIMTREHAHDVECLRSILPKSYLYAGLMGSRGRTEQVRRQMLEEGFDARKVEELHMPIGLQIGSRTPEEIAVSVTAELISVLNAALSGEGFPAGMAEELAELERSENARAMLAMIVEKHGEAPRRPGTKMLVRDDGSFLGTVGGGYAEAMILQTAGQMIREGERNCRLVRISMKKGTMYCGGEIAVLLMPCGAHHG